VKWLRQLAGHASPHNRLILDPRTNPKFTIPLNSNVAQNDSKVVNRGHC
jgi:hypothetical protein